MQKPANQKNSDDRELHQVLQKQSVITEMLIKQHNLSSLPRKEVPVFKGDPLTYKKFIRAFEHVVESRADTYQDKLLLSGAIHQWQTTGINQKL